MHSKLDDMKDKTYLSIYISIYVHVYLQYISTVFIHPYINLSMSVSVFLEITNFVLFVSSVCPTGDLWFYHKNAIIAAIRPQNLIVSLCETSQQNTTQKNIYLCIRRCFTIKN